MKRSFMKCLGTVTLFFAALAVGADVLGSPPLGAPRTIVWDLPANWEESGDLSSRYGIGKVGEPDLPIYTARIELPTGGTFVSATLAEVEWEEVEISPSPSPIAEWVRYGEELVYPEPDAAAYAGVYPSEFVVAGTPDVYRGVTRVPITVTPYKWDGTTRTLYKAKRLTVEVEVEERAAEDVRPYQKLKLSTSSQSPTTNNQQPQIIIVTPHDFVNHWNGYAAFRKSTEAGKDFEFIVKDTRTIYSDAKYWTKHCEATKNIERDDNADALAIHHYLEDVYDANRVQYIILTAERSETAEGRAA